MSKIVLSNNIILDDDLCFTFDEDKENFPKQWKNVEGVFEGDSNYVDQRGRVNRFDWIIEPAFKGVYPRSNSGMCDHIEQLFETSLYDAVKQHPAEFFVVFQTIPNTADYVIKFDKHGDYIGTYKITKKYLYEQKDMKQLTFWAIFKLEARFIGNEY